MLSLEIHLGRVIINENILRVKIALETKDETNFGGCGLDWAGRSDFSPRNSI